MKKYHLIIIFASISPHVFAGPGGGGGGFGGGGRGGGGMGGDMMMGRVEISQRQSFSQSRDLFDDLQERRREREERGFERLKHIKWQEGYTMPQHYRSDRYKVEPSEYQLSAPGKNQQWYKINNDFLLVDTNNAIVRVQ